MFRIFTGRPEPVLNSATIQALITAILGVVVAFGVGLDEEQRNAILGLTAAVCAIIFGGDLAARAKVTPIEPEDEMDMAA